MPSLDHLQSASGLLLIAAVAAIGVLHTLVPDHWAPIVALARQQHWSRARTARAALGAGAGHVLSTLVLGLIVWAAGVAVATKFGHWLELISSLALIGFGLWVAVAGWRELHHSHDHDHHHHHEHRATALLLILGSSPMIEGLPAFFAAGRLGIVQIVAMSVVFAASTIATYVALCVGSLAGLQDVRLGPLERYGEVISGLFIAAIGVAFWIW